MYLQATLITFHLKLRPLPVRLRGRFLCICIQTIGSTVKFQHVTVRGVFHPPLESMFCETSHIHAKLKKPILMKYNTTGRHTEEPVVIKAVLQVNVYNQKGRGASQVLHECPECVCVHLHTQESLFDCGLAAFRHASAFMYNSGIYSHWHANW